MGRKWIWVVQAFLAVSLLAACSSPPERTLSLQAPKYATLPNGTEPLDPSKPSSIYRSMNTGIPGDNAMRYLERKRGHALNILSLSGGGQNGAFGAGFLIGWRESGKRPEFDVVGGVSTGALLATHAFLGTPADDAILEEMYTKITAADIYTDRGIFSLLSADSLKDTAPLKAMIAKYVTADTLKRVAAAYDDYRALAVGTTNIDYSQTWVWNMGMIAKAGDLQLYRDVLLASASFPIVFPPVEIDGHLFVDGAARSNVVIPGMGGDQKPNPPTFGPGNLYLIDNGRVTEPPQALVRALGPVAATTISVMMEKSMQTALVRSYFGAKALGYTFNMVGIPDGVNIGNDPLAFDPAQMRAAFDAGRAMGMQDNPWHDMPLSSGDLPRWVFTDLMPPP